MGVPVGDKRRARLEAQRQIALEALRDIERQLTELDARPTGHKRPKFTVIKGGLAALVSAAWLAHHKAVVTAAASFVMAVPLIASEEAPMPQPVKAEAVVQQDTFSVDAPRPATRVPSSSGSTQGAVPSPMATTPLPTGTPGPAPAQHDAMPNPTPLQGAASPLEPEPGLAPPTPTPTVTPTLTPTPNPGLTRKAAVLECVGEPGGEPPEDLVACVDGLLGSSN